MIINRFRAFFPNLITLLNLFCGSIGVIYAVQGDLTVSAFFVIISLTPIAEIFLDSNLKNPSFLTKMISEYFMFFNITPTFWAFACVFIFGNFLKAGVDILNRYICLKIKYSLFRNYWSFAKL